MIDNPLPDQVMEARDVFYNHQEVEEVKEEFPNALEPFVIAEVQKRFEEMSA